MFVFSHASHHRVCHFALPLAAIIFHDCSACSGLYIVVVIICFTAVFRSVLCCRHRPPSLILPVFFAMAVPHVGVWQPGSQHLENRESWYTFLDRHALGHYIPFAGPGGTWARRVAHME